MNMRIIGIMTGALLVAGLFGGSARGEPPAGGTFGDDLEFLKKNGEVIVLSADQGQAQVIVSAKYQGRVMTSTSAGLKGLSYGWINRELIASGKTLEHFNPVGGEERFWMGPEGGQFSIFFAKDAPFDLAHWYTPAAVDTEPFEVVSKGESSAVFHRSVSIVNYSGTKFDVLIDREIRLIPSADALKDLGLEPLKQVNVVAFESVNKISNNGAEPWTKEKGLLSIWILCMFNPSPATTVVVPIKAGPESELGKVVTDDYFGKVPAERLMVKDQVVFFSADGKCRSKIGFNPKRCRGVLGSYDAANKVLTLASYTLPKEPADYVNSEWKIQEKPFAGDAVNSYNDGPTSPGGKPLGPFYELESSSPAAALAPKQSITHTHRTIHLQGSEADLDPIARKVLGVSLQDIVTALTKKP